MKIKRPCYCGAPKRLAGHEWDESMGCGDEPLDGLAIFNFRVPDVTGPVEDVPGCSNTELLLWVMRQRKRR